MNDLMAKVANLSTNRIAFFSLLICIVYYFVFYDSGVTIDDEILAIRAQIAEETTKKIETEKILKKEEQMRSDVAMLAKTYEEVKSKIPIDFESSELRAIVEQVSNASSLKIATLKDQQQQNDMGSIPEANLVEQVVIDYKFQGTYSQIKNFVIQLAQVEKVIKVSNMRITVPSVGDGPGKFLDMDTSIIGYKQSAEIKKSKNSTAAEKPNTPPAENPNKEVNQ